MVSIEVSIMDGEKCPSNAPPLLNVYVCVCVCIKSSLYFAIGGVDSYFGQFSLLGLH